MTINIPFSKKKWTTSLCFDLIDVNCSMHVCILQIKTNHTLEWINDWNDEKKLGASEIFLAMIVHKSILISFIKFQKKNIYWNLSRHLISFPATGIVNEVIVPYQSLSLTSLATSLISSFSIFHVIPFSTSSDQRLDSVALIYILSHVLFQRFFYIVDCVCVCARTDVCVCICPYGLNYT